MIEQLNDVNGNKECHARKLNNMYKTLMQEHDSELKYTSRRVKVAENIKAKNYWPEGMKHPQEYRGFYWTDDMAFCGFATLSH
jgi:hypothetical protein